MYKTFQVLFSFKSKNMIDCSEIALTFLQLFVFKNLVYGWTNKGFFFITSVTL